MNKLMSKKLFWAFKRMLVFLFGGYVFSIIMYDKKYRQTEHFRGFWSVGYTWSIYDALSRLLTGKNRKVPWPCSPLATVHHPENIIFDPNDLHIFQTHGTYFQGLNAQTVIGKGTWIAPNVGIITCNHDFGNLTSHGPGANVVIGSNCWIGMNSVILKGVNLGDNTIVGAGSVVTKSFPEGNVVIGGNPAKVLKTLR